MLSSFFGFFRKQKSKIMLGMFLFIIFLYLFFPFNDLGDLVSAKVSEATQGQVFVSFDRLNLNIIPSPGITLSEVILETPGIPILKAGELIARPSILGIITFKPGISLFAENFLGGDFSITTRGAEKNKNGNRKQKLDLNFEGLKLENLIQLFDSSLQVNGIAQGEISSLVDVDFTEQPKSDLKLNIDKLVLDETDIVMQGLPINIPKISLNKLILEAKSENGNLNISKFSFGGTGQDLTGQLSGRINLNVIKSGTLVSMQPGGFDLNLKFTMSEVLKQKLSSYLGLLQSYLVAQNTYSLKITGSSFYGIPQITKGP
ncbi:MAG: type II secretion system protein GspN [Oligoflexia bacterium]|nr:type II secretion system protein GspN [Oligoflexia bacterium]